MLENKRNFSESFHYYMGQLMRMKQKLVLDVVGGTLMLGMALMLCGSAVYGEGNKTTGKDRDAVVETSGKGGGKEQAGAGDADAKGGKLPEVVKSAEEIAREEQMIEEVLSGDKYGAELRGIYETYPQLRSLLLNREAYPDWLIEYFIGHQEAVDWVVAYPEYMARDAAQIDAEALAPVDMEEYDLQNGIPQFFQWSSDWGYASYGNGVIAVEGCGPTCLSMVLTGLTGDTSLTPKKVADFSASSGYYTEDAGTDWSLMQEGARALGLNAQQIQSWSANVIRSELKAGRPIISSMGPGDFTEQGHFIVLTGVTDDGKIQLNDPNSRVNSNKTWDANTILEQMKAMWSYSR